MMKKIKEGPTASRKDYQLARRMIHMGCGVTVGLLYHFLLTHQQAVHILGTMACILYILEQVRVNYPEFSEYFNFLTNYFLRAEEQIKESAGVPFLMAVLLAILSFPKSIALLAIFTLAISDPLSALFGIRFGKRKIVKNKSLEGSTAFFISCLCCSMIIFSTYTSATTLSLTLFSFTTALLVTAFEMLPLRLDDNLTIPIFTAIVSWPLTAVFGISLI